MLEASLPGLLPSPLMVIAVVVPLLALSAEVGHRIGALVFKGHDEPRKAVVVGTMSPVLGLLALVLAFTFAMAAERYGVRRDQIVEESNAIGTAWLRSGFAPEPQATTLRATFVRYVDARLDFYAAGADGARIVAAEHEAAALQKVLWAQVEEAAAQRPTPPVTSLAIAVNEVIDMDASRLQAVREHVPAAVWWLVVLVACFGSWVSGYYGGASGGRSALTHLLLPALIGLVVAMTADLDNSRGGLIGISQQPLIDLQTSLAASR
jgi:hypothetical protein